MSRSEARGVQDRARSRRLQAWQKRSSTAIAALTAVLPVGLLLAGLLLALGGCGGNVLSQFSTEWIDVHPAATPLEQAKLHCRSQASEPAAAPDTYIYCMRRHGWVEMTDPLLE